MNSDPMEHAGRWLKCLIKNQKLNYRRLERLSGISKLVWSRAAHGKGVHSLTLLRMFSILRPSEAQWLELWQILHDAEKEREGVEQKSSAAEPWLSKLFEEGALTKK